MKEFASCEDEQGAIDWSYPGRETFYETLHQVA